MTIDREKKQYINKKFTTRNFIKTMEHEDIPEVEELLKERKARGVWIKLCKFFMLTKIY